MVKIDPKKYPVLVSKPLEQWHKEMWEYLAKYPHKDKSDFINEVFSFSERMLLFKSWDCFACLFVGRSRKRTNNSCDFCPLCSYGQNGLNCLHGLYDKYIKAKDAEDYGEVRKIATQIANLQWRIK